jgi:hypothetical protein
MSALDNDLAISRFSGSRLISAIKNKRVEEQISTIDLFSVCNLLEVVADLNSSC